MAADYGKYKVTELKDMLKERGIASTGLSRKQQYVDALEAADAGNNADADTRAKPNEIDAPDEDASAVPEADAESGLDDPSTLATPQQISQAPEEASSDTKKRKRRSVTPPLTEESVSKKLKAGDEGAVKLPEDEMVEDVSGSIEGPLESKARAQPSAAGNDVLAAGPNETGTEETTHSYPALSTAHQAAPKEFPSDGALHPPTRALYIRELIRPLNPNQLREHLEDLAAAAGATSPAINTFHLDVLRTHAFVAFASVHDAIRVRSALHGSVFPDEPTRRPLWVDFVPEEKVNEWIDIEMQFGTSRRDAKRWEVIYETEATTRDVTTALQEVPSVPALGRQSSFNQQSADPQNERHAHPSEPPVTARAPSYSPSDARKPSATAPTPQPETFNVLDERFMSTTTKPKLYYLPMDKELAERRLEELRRETSRDWDGGKPEDFDGPLRRYTFEDGDRLVDNGPDRGSFGVPARRGGAFSGGGRGGGGGYRGGGGDRYRR